MSKRLVAALVVLTLAVLTAGCGRHRATEALPPGTATVVRNVDGDTIVVEVDRREEPVRLIGIDTPETVSRDRPVECFGPEAAARLMELLPPGTVVRLERDVEARDRYDRLLAYVIRAHDDLHINLLMVEEGYAASVRYPPNLARQADLDRAQAAAQAAPRGLWPACGGTDVPIDG
jgi:micrococcal nuclease